MSAAKELSNMVFKSLERISSDKWVVSQKRQLSVLDKDVRYI